MFSTGDYVSLLENRTVTPLPLEWWFGRCDETPTKTSHETQSPYLVHARSSRDRGRLECPVLAWLVTPYYQTGAAGHHSSVRPQNPGVLLRHPVTSRGRVEQSTTTHSPPWLLGRSSATIWTSDLEWNNTHTPFAALRRIHLSAKGKDVCCTG